MNRRHRRASHHESPQEQHLREIVDGLVQVELERAAYLAFAHELVRAERASYSVRRTSLCVPDCSRRTKNVVAKWFRRGLSGHLMWLIGREILGEVRMTNPNDELPRNDGR